MKRKLLLYALLALLLLSLVAISSLVPTGEVEEAPSHLSELEEVSDWLRGAGEQNQNHIIYASGLYWAFYCDDTHMVCKATSDFTTWSDKTIIRSGIRAYYFDILFDSTYLHYVWGSGRSIHARFYYRRGIPQSDGTIYWSAAEQEAAPHCGTSPVMDVDSSGHIWIVYQWGICGSGKNNRFYVTKNNNTDGTWSTASGYPLDLGETLIHNGRIQGSICALTDGKMYAAWAWQSNDLRTTSPVYGKLYNGTVWGSKETVSTRNVTYLAGNSVSVDAINDDVITVYPAKQDNKTQISFNYRNYTLGSWEPEQNVSSILPSDWNVDKQACGPAMTLDPPSQTLWVYYANIKIGMIYIRNWTSGTWNAEEEFYDFSQKQTMNVFWVNAKRRAWKHNLCIIFDSNTDSTNKVWLIDKRLPNSSNRYIDVPYSSNIPDIDGHWSRPTEWKDASETRIEDDSGSTIYFRLKHNQTRIFALLDFVTDQSEHDFDKGGLCFDTLDNGGDFPETDDYLFGLWRMYDWQTKVFQGTGLGGSPTEAWIEIDTPSDGLGFSGFSSINNPYEASAEHQIYEFAIPCNFLGYASRYGIYVFVTDHNSNTLLEWPKESGGNYYYDQMWYSIPPAPRNWGSIGDHFFPEFSPLNVFLSLNSNTVDSEGRVSADVHVTYGTFAVENAYVQLASDKGGSFAASSGYTDSNGDFSSVYTAPNVYEQTTVNITATASKSGYADGSDSKFVLNLPSLSVSVSANPSIIEPAESSTITVNVTDGNKPVVRAAVSLRSDNGGMLSRESGITDSTGVFTCTFTAPDMPQQLTCTITVDATKRGYRCDQCKTHVTVERQKTSKLLWLPITLVVASIAVFAAPFVARKWKSRKASKSSPTVRAH